LLVMATQPFLSATKVVYHWKASNFTGKKIVDLHTLHERMPELFSGAKAKYETSFSRKTILMHTAIPNIGCSWNSAIHTSTIHPQLILDAKRKYGLSTGLEDGAMTGEYFVIPVQKLLDAQDVNKMVHWNFPSMGMCAKLGFLLNCGLKYLGSWCLLNRGDFPVLDQKYLDEEFKQLESVPEATELLYKQWGEDIKSGKKPQILTYMLCPHVLVQGEIDIEGLEVIRVK